MIEIERKFLVTSLPADMGGGTRILQGYLAYEEHLEVRIRQYGDTFFLTVKEGPGLMRRETEIEISPDQFHALWPSTEGRRLEKVRSLVVLRSVPGGGGPLSGGSGTADRRRGGVLFGG